MPAEPLDRSTSIGLEGVMNGKEGKRGDSLFHDCYEPRASSRVLPFIPQTTQRIRQSVVTSEKNEIKKARASEINQNETRRRPSAFAQISSISSSSSSSSSSPNRSSSSSSCCGPPAPPIFLSSSPESSSASNPAASNASRSLLSGVC